MFDAAKIEKKSRLCNGWAHKSSSGHMLMVLAALCRGSPSLSASARIFVPVGLAGLCRGLPPDGREVRLGVGKPDVKLSMKPKAIAIEVRYCPNQPSRAAICPVLVAHRAAPANIYNLFFFILQTILFYKIICFYQKNNLFFLHNNLFLSIFASVLGLRPLLFALP